MAHYFHFCNMAIIFGVEEEVSRLMTKMWKSWVRSFGWALGALVALIAYASTRDYFIQSTNIYIVGYVEGAFTMIVIFLFAVKYGDALNEVYFGLRELGRKRIEREEQKENQSQKQIQ